MSEVIKALLAARAAVAGTVYKAGMKSEGGGGRYAYVGHEHVVLHVRKAMLDNGLALIQVGTTELADGKWRGTFKLVHEKGGELDLSYECRTAPTGDKVGFIASTALDRTALLRVMGLAGSADEDPEHNSNNKDETPPRASTQQRVADRNDARASAATSVAQEVAHHISHLPGMSQYQELVEWAAWLTAQAYDKAAKAPAWNAFAERCRAVGLEPSDLTAAFRARAQQIAVEQAAGRA